MKYNRGMAKAPIGLLAALLWSPALVLAGSVAGICPDGSAFIVGRKADAPCVRARFVEDPSQLPPLRPELLPRPYTWTLDQRARDPNNPYNLLEAVEKMNKRHAAEPAAELREPRRAPIAASGLAPAPPVEATPPIGLALDENEIRDLVRLVALRQELAPATYTVEDIEHHEQLLVRVAHSAAFEERVLGALGEVDKHVLLFSARSVQHSEFHPNFFLVRDGMTFRPDPQNSREVGFIVGDPGELEQGYLVLGYLVIPGRFDPRESLEIWWNDRSVVTTLQP